MTDLVAAADHAAAADHLIRLPSVRRLVRQTTTHVVEAVLIPAATFYAVLSTVSLRWALIATMLWSFAAIGARIARGARVSGMLLVSAALITARTAVAFVANSSFVYFLQPSLANFCIALAFLASLVPGRPLTRRLADDFCTLPASLDHRPRCTQFFTRLTVLWALVCAANGALTLMLLLHNSVGSFLALRPVVSYGLVAVGTVLSYLWFRTTLRAEGLKIVFGDRLARALPGRG
jgi:uncharacterized membrane protein